MDPQVYDINATLDLSTDKQNIVRQLSDMFYGYSLVYIRGICESCLWNVDLCVDKLIGGVGGRDAAELIKNKIKEQPQVFNYSQAVQKPSPGAASCEASISAPTKPSIQNLPAAYSHVYNDIIKGYKVLVLMRGAPGSGKSHLAKSIIKNLMPGEDWKNYVFGADDYFFDARGHYRYNVDRLEEAHQYCQTRAREKMQLGYSPIIIDNTNNQLWEMMVYVKIGVENGYIIEIVEPVTSWRHSAGKLAVKNTHNVPKQKIQRMLDRFEVGTSKDLLGLLKETKYTVALPQTRIYPSPPEPESSPLPELEPKTVPAVVPEPQAQPPPTPTKTDDAADESLLTKDDYASSMSFSNPTNMWPSFESLDNILPAPKSPRKNQKVKEDDDKPEAQQQEEEKENKAPRKLSKPLNPDAPSFWGVPLSGFDSYDSDTNHLFPSVPTVWQSYEQEATNFWGVPISEATGSSPLPVVEPMVTSDSSSSNNCGLLQLLKEGVKSINVPSKENDESFNPMVRHRIGCSNENDSFVALRQIYPNKPTAELWDLFVKCNGSVDWAVDILLKDEDSIVNQNAFQDSSLENQDDQFNCCCDRLEASTPPPAPSQPTTSADVKPQRQKPARNRNVPTPAQVQEVKEALEKSFVLGEEHYSSHVKKIRNKRNATEDPASTKKTFADFQVQTDLESDETDTDDGAEGSEVIEVNLGVDLIGQLSQIFISETTPLDKPEKYKTNVFMPKSLARELYVLWMESVYNQQEEQRQQLLKEDEEFARLLKNPKYQNLKQPPENIKELLDMEYAWMIYKQQQEQYNGMTAKQHPNDLASHLTRMKLCEIFPNIPRETLLDILAAHNNKFSDTVEVLKSSIQPATVDHQVSAEVLIEKARNENEVLQEEEAKQEQKLLKNNQNNAFQKVHSKQQTDSPTRHRSLSPEEAKRLALSEFEETRNYAAHHCQLRAECYQKAKEAIQRGNSGVAVYYSQIANLHKRKIDIYNHRAANCIMEVHDLTQNNPDFIDLHYLHVVEAVACLDIFVDRHIAKLRSIFRSFKYVFIITGRGLHSAGGVSMIKTRVKSRLKERNLKWSEVNPGLLKVKIFSASKYSKNL